MYFSASEKRTESIFSADDLSKKTRLYAKSFAYWENVATKSCPVCTGVARWTMVVDLWNNKLCNFNNVLKQLCIVDDVDSTWSSRLANFILHIFRFSAYIMKAYAIFWIRDVDEDFFFWQLIGSCVSRKQWRGHRGARVHVLSNALSSNRRSWCLILLCDAHCRATTGGLLMVAVLIRNEKTPNHGGS